MENSTVIATIIFKYIRKDITPAENDLLQEWIADAEENRLFFEECIHSGHLFTEAQERAKYDQEIKMEDLWQQLTVMGIPAGSYTFKTVTARRTWYAVTVLLVTIILAGLYIWSKQTPVAKKEITATVTKRDINDLSPAQNSATLTLGNGSVVQLDSVHRGLIAVEGKTQVTSISGQGLRYSSAGEAQPVLFNTLSVPRGGDVTQLTLADGTKIWLNTASSIRYPVVFDNSERKVEITGEAYFEVMHNAKIPFKVTKGNMEITVLGTHFNVDAYDDDENAKITLLQGAVKVSLLNNPGADNKVLEPGQQAQVDKRNAIIVHTGADERTVMAWKDRLFYFSNTSIDVIVRQLERWYDLSIEYDPALKTVAFNGQISRYNNAVKILKMLAATQSLHYRINGRKVYLTP